MFEVWAMFAESGALAGEGHCFRVAGAVGFLVQLGRAPIEVPVFVEDRSTCDVPPIPEPPYGVRGRAAIEWVLARSVVDGRPTHGLWSRGDAWIVAPLDGARVLDTVVRLDPAGSATLDDALQSLNAQIPRAVRFQPDYWFGHAPPPEPLEGPLLEVLRAMYAPVEDVGDPVSFVVYGEGTISQFRNRAASLLSEPYPTRVEALDGNRPGRAPNGEVFTIVPGETLCPGCVFADELVQTGPDGTRFYDTTPPSPARVVPRDEPPPPYPFPLPALVRPAAAPPR